MVSSGKYFPVSIIVEDEGAFKVGETYVVGKYFLCMARGSLLLGLDVCIKQI